MYCIKSWQIGHGRAVLAMIADSAHFWSIGQNWLCYLAHPFHALFGRISCNTYLESLKHADQSWVGFVAGFWLYFKLYCSALWRAFKGLEKYKNSWLLVDEPLVEKSWTKCWAYLFPMLLQLEQVLHLDHLPFQKSLLGCLVYVFGPSFK